VVVEQAWEMKEVVEIGVQFCSSPDTDTVLQGLAPHYVRRILQFFCISRKAWRGHKTVCVRDI
jgi:hypothetical protein